MFPISSSNFNYNPEEKINKILNQFEAVWSQTEDFNTILTLTEELSSKAQGCLRFFRREFEKTSPSEKRACTYLEKLNWMESKVLNSTSNKLAQTSRTLFPNQPLDQVPVLPQCLIDTKELLAERKAFVQRVCTLYKQLNLIKSLYSQKGFFTLEMPKAEKNHDKILCDLEEIKNQNGCEKIEDALRDLFRSLFKKIPSGRGYGPGLRQRMECLKTFTVPKQYQDFFFPLMKELAAEQLKRLKILKYKDQKLPDWIRLAFDGAVEEAQKPVIS